MKPNDFKTEEIKAALRNRHIVVTDSQTGKSCAIVALMQEDWLSPVVVVVPTRKHGKLLAELYWGCYGKHPTTQQIVVGSNRLRFGDEIVIVDELQINQYRGPFWAATATFSNPVTLITKDKGVLTNDARAGV